MRAEDTLDFLAEVRSQLAALGIETVLTEEQTLCGELTAHGAAYATLHVLIAEAYFEGVPTLKKASAYQDYLYESVSDPGPGAQKPAAQKPAYVLIVGRRAFIECPAFAVVLCELEACGAVAKKHVCAVDDLATWVVNPFEAWPVLDAPELTLFTDNPLCEDYSATSTDRYLDALSGRKRLTLPSGPEVCHFTGALDIPAALEQLAGLPDRERSQRLVNTLFRRVISTEMSLAWDADRGPLLSRAGCGELPLPCWSNGERLVFALCAFLALVHAKAEGPCSLVIHAISGLDALRRLAVLDCLRDFVHATGARLWVRCVSNKASMLNIRVGDAVKRVRDAR